jgi:anti-sigma28 factor (negative regulator of flagellin synthesis)
MGKKPSSPSGPAPAEQAEKVHISKAARELLRQSELMADAHQKLQSQGDVRQDRVAEVRAQIESGAYDSKAVKNELAQRLANILGDLPYSGDSGS